MVIFLKPILLIINKKKFQFQFFNVKDERFKYGRLSIVYKKTKQRPLRVAATASCKIFSSLDHMQAKQNDSSPFRICPTESVTRAVAFRELNPIPRPAH